MTNIGPRIHLSVAAGLLRRSAVAISLWWRYPLSVSMLTVLILCSPAASQERSPRTRTDATDEFPEFSLPRLSGDDPTGSRPLPSVDENSGAKGSPRTSPERRTGGSFLDGAIPLDPVNPDLRDNDRSPFPGRVSPEPAARGTASEFFRDEATGTLPLQTGPLRTDDASFDWTQQPVSIADIRIGREWPFEHGKANLTESEADGYVALIRAVMDQRSLVPGYLPENVSLTSVWETAFYRYSEVRRQAWQNGKLQLQVRSSIGEPDFFGSGSAGVLSTTDRALPAKDLTAYSLEVDMQAHPAEFVGRPVVLYGLFTPSGAVELQAKRTLEGEERVFTLQRGFLKNLRNTETIAILDAISYVDPQSQKVPSTAWPVEKRVAIPVLVKGWFVKLWGQRPLIFTDVVRILTPRPYDEYIRDHVRSRRKVSEDEGWLYYETLRQLQVTSAEVQSGIARLEQQARVKQLLQEVRDKAGADRLVLENQLRSGTISRTDEGEKPGYETRRRRIERQLELREGRYRQYEKNPETFPAFVDVFQNPDRWQGRLVTLRGHVRRVTKYSGDTELFAGQPLHELWLFTDDSQQNPAVIITPSLPKDFPLSAEIVDAVTVTGCCFKMYVYRSQQDNRLAPLFLAGHLSWNPSADQVLSLARNGHIAAGSPLVATAKSQSRSVSDTMILLLGFLALLIAMTAWGRVQRDRRERQRLLSLVDERPDFRQTSQDLFYGPFADSRIEPTRG